MALKVTGYFGSNLTNTDPKFFLDHSRNSISPNYNSRNSSGIAEFPPTLAKMEPMGAKIANSIFSQSGPVGLIWPFFIYSEEALVTW